MLDMAIFDLTVYPIVADQSVTTALIAFAGILAAAGGAAWGIRRAKSGKIETTEAADLWKEAGIMRTELRDEVAHLNGEIRTLREENQDLKNENSEYKRRLEAMENVVRQLRDRVMELEKVHG